MKILVLLLSFILLLSSCEKKQKLRAKKESRQQAINGCKNAQFVGEVLSKENTLNLFRCLGWHLELSSLYDEIENFNDTQWNIFTSPLNEIFFKEANYEMRGQLFNLFYKLEKDGSLDQLSTFLSKVDFKGLSDLTSVIIRCKKQGECTEHDLEVSRSLIPDEDSYNNLILLLDYFKQALSKNDQGKVIKDLQSLLSDAKMDYFIYDLIKNDGRILQDKKFQQLVLKPIKDILFK